MIDLEQPLETNTGHAVELVSASRLIAVSQGHKFSFDLETGKIFHPTMFTHVRNVPDYRYADLMSDASIGPWRECRRSGRRCPDDKRAPVLTTLRWNLTDNSVDNVEYQP